MPLDGISAHFLNQELVSALQGAKLAHIDQVDRHSLYLTFRRKGEKTGVFLSINPSQSFLFLSKQTPPVGADQGPFVQLLQKKLAGFTLLTCKNPPAERIFQFHFEGRNQIGETEKLCLIAEIMGKYSNLILLRADGSIYDAMRHVDHSVNRYREVMPARKYVAPPPQEKLFWQDLLAEHAEEIRQGQAHFSFLESDRKVTVERFLVQELAGCSPLLARDLVYRAGLPETYYMSDLSPADRHKLSQVLAQTLLKIEQGDIAPALYYLEPEKRLAQDFYSLELAGFPYKESYPGLHAAMAAYYSKQWQQAAFRKAAQRLGSQLAKLGKNLRRKQALHAGDLREGKKAAEYKLYGDLLQAKIYQIPAKAKQVTVENYYEPDLPQLEIPLDPSLSPAQNIDHYYKRYRKAKAKYAMAREFLTEDQHNLDWWGNLMTLFERAENEEDLAAIEDELEALTRRKRRAPAASEQPDIPMGQLLNPGRPGKKKKYKEPKGQKKKVKKTNAPQRKVYPFREFRSSDGFSIQVGRNNLENDRLTFKHSRKDDLWFHARQLPGSHTVLHLEGKTPSDQAILEAAQIAAYYSSANQTVMGAKVEVDYCPIKYVKNIPGTKPGLVNYSNHRTAYVEAKLPRSYSDGA